MFKKIGKGYYGTVAIGLYVSVKIEMVGKFLEASVTRTLQ